MLFSSSSSTSKKATSSGSASINQSTNDSCESFPLPYLVVGTEVSAKFKGAFCEAKIKKCALALKCKLTLKTAGSTGLTVSYDQLRTSANTAITYNDLKPNSTVYVSKEVVASGGATTSQSKANQADLQPATLNKVIDQSVYTVVFNDGDEKTLKRSFIRFKVTVLFTRSRLDISFDLKYDISNLTWFFVY